MTGRGLRGAIVFALTSFVPEAPFSLYRETDGRVLSFAMAVELGRAVRAGDLPPEPAFLVRAKIRPVVLLQDRPRGVLPEYAALKLTRLEKLSKPAVERIRSGEEPAAFYLPANKAKYGLSKQNAIDLNSLVRIHRSGLVGDPVGWLDADEIDLLGRRVARYLDIDLGPAIRDGVIAKLRELTSRQPAQGA